MKRVKMLKIFRRVEAARNLVRTLENQIQLPVTNQSLPENFRDVRKRSTLNYASLARVGRVESTNASESDKGDQNHEDLQAANEALGKAIDSKDRWLESVGNVVAKQNFIDMAHKCVQPGYDYYEKTFNDSNGRMYNIKKSFQAASVFNVIELTRMNEVEVSLLLEKLPCFDFAEFTNNFEEFHAGLMKEFPEVQRQAKHSVTMDEFSTLPGAREYDVKLENKKKLDLLQRNQGRAEDTEEANDCFF